MFYVPAMVLKRVLDLLASGLLLATTAPLFLAVALAVRVSSPGPVLFSHPRHGKDGAVFNVLKFRTMVVNGDEVLTRHLVTNPKLRAEWNRDHKLRDDPRITPVGKWLRRYSLDELPQFLNVALGQMSLVGPRPIVTDEILKYGGIYDLYTRVRPGITGLWQVSGRNKTTYSERIAYDEFYVRNWTLRRDVEILLRTVKVVVRGEGAY